MGLAAVLVLVAAGCACDVDLGAVGDPGDGTTSAHLDVGADPSTGLEDGTVVRVVGAGFDPDETITGDGGGGIIVGVALCLSEADTERRGVDACDTDSGYRYAATPDGVLDVTFPVPRVITVGGVAYDCAEQAGRCLLVAANASDYDNSGGTPLTFREDLPPLDDLALFLAVADTGGLAAAARMTGVPLPTLSRRMAELERRTARRLFLRGKKGYALTAEEWEARRDELMAVRDDLAGAFAALKPDARPGLRCAGLWRRWRRPALARRAARRSHRCRRPVHL